MTANPVSETAVLEPGMGVHDATSQPGEATLRLENDFASLDGWRSAWDEAVLELGGSIYMSYDWSRTWWEFYGTGKDLRIFWFSAGGKTVGVVPIYIDRIGFGPCKFSIARLVCANIPPKAFHPAVHPDWAAQIFEAILKQLFERDRCDVLSLGPLSSEHETVGHLESVARSKRDIVSKVTVLFEGVSSVFNLPKSLDEYFEGMDKSERKKRKYELRLLRRELPVTEDVVSSPASVEAEFEDFARLHALQWQGRGKFGHFGSWPKGLEFNRALVRSLAKVGRVRFVRILADNQVVSSQYAFAFGNSYFWELPARIIGPKWQRFSLGAAGFFGLVDAAIKEGKTRVEGGLAHYDYKQKLNATEHATKVVRVVRRQLGSRTRTGLFLLLRFCCLWGYHKIWYARISPRLPAPFRKPIWPFWLRLDF